MKKIILFILFLASLILFSIFVSAQQTGTIKKFHTATYESDSIIYVRYDETIPITDSINVIFTDTANLIRFVNITKKTYLNIKLIEFSSSKTIESYNKEGQKENLIVVWFYCLVNDGTEMIFTTLSLQDGEIVAVGLGTDTYFTIISLKRKK